MRGKSLILLMLALGCGLVAAISITQVMATRDAEPAHSGAETTPIIVAMETIDMGDAVALEQIKLEDWPAGKVPEGALTSLEDVEGRRTRTKIYKGAPILEDQLLVKGGYDAGAAPLIPRGYRVVSVKVDAVSGSASMIRPSDRVDVIAYFSANPSRGIAKSMSRTILQNIKVFAVDSKYEIRPGEEEESTRTTSRTSTVSLLVTPEQAEMITAASEVGEIRLAMRGLGDDESTTPRGVSATELLGLASEIGDPDKEKLPGQEDAMLAALLNAQQAEQQPQPAAPSREQWSIRFITGGSINDVTLEAETRPGTTVEDEPRWRVIDEVGSGAFEAELDNPFADAPDVPPAPPESEPEKPEPGDQPIEPGEGDS